MSKTTSEGSQESSKFKPQRKKFGAFPKFQLVIFVISFASIASFILFRSFAASPILLNYASIDTAHSSPPCSTLVTTNCYRTVIETNSSKRNSRVVELATGSLTAPSQVSFLKTNLTTGLYQVCLYAFTPSGTASGALNVFTYKSGVTSSSSVAGRFYSIPAAANYAKASCLDNVKYDGTVTGLNFTVANFGPALRIGSVMLARTGDLPTTTPTNVTQVPTTLPHDCSRDVTNEINYMISLLPSKSILVFPANGCYKVNGTITIEGQSGLTIDGGNSTFRAFTNGTEWNTTQYPNAARTRSQFNIMKSSNITIKNAIAYGANPLAGLNDKAYVSSLEAQHGFNISSSSNITLDHVQAKMVYGDFVYIGGSGTNLSKNVMVKNSTFSNNGRIGISVVNAQYVTIDNNSLDQMRRSVFDMEPYAPSWRIEHVTFSNNSIGPARLNLISSFGTCAVVSDISVLNNHLHNQEMNSEIINSSDCSIRRKNFIFSGNTSDKAFGTPSGMVIKFQGVDGIVLTNNKQPLQAGRNMHLARMNDSTGGRATGNILLNGVGTLFTTDGSNDYCHSNNKIGADLHTETTTKPCL